MTSLLFGWLFNKLEHDLIADWLTSTNWSMTSFLIGWLQQIGAWPHCWLVDLPEFVILRLLVELIRWMFLFGPEMISCPITLQNSNETLMSSCSAPVRSINEPECEFMAGYRTQADISCYTGIRKKIDSVATIYMQAWNKLQEWMQRVTCKIATSYNSECNELLTNLQ